MYIIYYTQSCIHFNADYKWIHAIFQYNRNVMITTLKKHIQDCTDTMNKYSTHLDLMQPLPESPILQQLQDKWEEKEVCVVYFIAAHITHQAIYKILITI